MAKREDTKKPSKKDSAVKKRTTPADRNKGKRGSSRNSRENFKESEERPKRAARPETKFAREEKPYRGKGRSDASDRPYPGKSRTSHSDRPYRGKSSSDHADKPYYSKSRSEGTDKPYRGRQSDRSEGTTGYRSDSEYAGRPSRDRDSREERSSKPYLRGKFKRSTAPEYKPKKQDGLVRLNKYLSNAGIASRRDADQLIELGLVKVNGKIVTELGYKVDPRVDVVKYDDKSIKPEKLRYVLLNKPKDFITTMEDPEERKTVMWLIKEACKERVYPVGRLDRQTTGLLLFTNDGDLAKRLTHPRHNVQKIYHVETLEKIRGADLDAIRKGVELEDGFIKADEISLANDDPRQVGIRIHSGKNRIVRRIFEHFNYTVKKLDRVMFAGLTKKDLPRGRYRHLTEQEVNFLKMIR